MDPASGSLDKVNSMWGMTGTRGCLLRDELLTQHLLPKKTFLAGELLCPSLRSSQGWRHKPNTANSPGHVSHSPQISQSTEVIPGGIIPRNYCSVLPGICATISIPSPLSILQQEQLRSFIHPGMAQPSKGKKLFCFHLSLKASPGELQHL